MPRIDITTGHDTDQRPHYDFVILRIHIIN